MRMIIDEIKRVELENYIKSKINTKSLNEILYGCQQKNPFYL